MTSSVVRKQQAAQRFRDTIQNLAGSVCVVAVEAGGSRTGFVASSVISFSAEPPILGFAVNVSSSSWPALQEARRFSVNILASDQQRIAENFSGRGGAKGEDRYVDGEWTVLTTGVPVLEGALASLDCELDEAILRHSHAFVLGQVVDQRLGSRATPLLYWRRDYRDVAAREPGPGGSGHVVLHSVGSLFKSHIA